MFQPEVLRSDAESLDIKFHACPLREAWQESGLSDAEVATLCRIAARIDNGTFEAAGFQLLRRHLAAGRRRLLLPAYSAQVG